MTEQNAGDESLVDPREREQVGAEIARATGRVSRRDFQRWAAAVGDHNPLYFDAEYARAAGYRDVVAPPAYVQYATLGVYSLGGLRPDGIPDAVGVSLSRCPRRMAGGDELVIHHPLYDGDELTAVRRIEAIEQKQGRSGSFVLVTSRVSYQRGTETVAEIHSTMIARP
jgi:acyl dehydratase